MDPTRTVTNNTPKAVRTVHRRFRMTLHQASRSGGCSVLGGRNSPGIAGRRSTRTSRGLNNSILSILFESLVSGIMPSPPVDRDPSGGLQGGFGAAIEHAFCRAIGDKDDVLG